MICSFTRDEFRIMNLWAQNTVNGGHWGDGQVMLGEESILLAKIRKALSEPDGSGLELSPPELRVLNFWREDNGKDADRMTGDPAAVSLAKKIVTLSGHPER